MKEITVIIPAYNIESYLDRCFENLVNQTYRLFDVIVINDGSTDNTLTKLNHWQDLDERIKVIDKKNEGVGITRNLGLSMVKTPYVIFIDPDDYMHTTMLEKMVAKAKQTEADLILCDYMEWYEHSDEQHVVKMPRLKESPILLKENKKLFSQINPAPWNKLIKTMILKNVNVTFPTDIRSEDLVFTQLLLANIKTLAICEEPLYFYLANRLNNVSSTFDNRILHTVMAVDRIRYYYEENGLMSNYKTEIECLTINQFKYELKKVPYIKDNNLAHEIMNSFYQYLKQYFPNWKKNKYYQEYLNSLSFKQRIQEKIYDSKLTLGIYRKIKN